MVETFPREVSIGGLPTHHRDAAVLTRFPAAVGTTCLMLQLKAKARKTGNRSQSGPSLRPASVIRDLMAELAI
jgi:hypothetical protein